MAKKTVTPNPTPDGPGPADFLEASTAWLDEAEAQRAAQGGFVTMDQSLGFALAYGLLALLDQRPLDGAGLATALEGLCCPAPMQACRDTGGCLDGTLPQPRAENTDPGTPSG